MSNYELKTEMQFTGSQMEQICKRSTLVKQRYKNGRDSIFSLEFGIFIRMKGSKIWRRQDIES